MIFSNLQAFQAFRSRGGFEDKAVSARHFEWIDRSPGEGTAGPAARAQAQSAAPEERPVEGAPSAASPSALVAVAPSGGTHSVLDSELQALAAYAPALSAMTAGAAQALLAAQFPHLQFSGDKVSIEIGAENPAALLAKLEAMGLEQGATAGFLVSGLLPIAAVAGLAEVSGLRFARSSQAITRVGSTTYQGDEAMLTDDVRTDEGLDGSGISVGVLSDSFNDLGGYANDIASGDLPNNVNVIADLGASGSDEGRAMAQIVHDIAPGAGLLFATAFTGQAGFASNIIALANAGAEIIVDDVGYLTAPMFQDGVVAQAVDQVTAGGVLYFSSAGNQDDDSYESAFVDGGDLAVDFGGGNIVDYDMHDFDPGAGFDTALSITIPIGGVLHISFQWDQPFFSVSGGSGSQSNLDLFLVEAGTLNVVDFEVTNNIGGDAVEILRFVNGTGGTNFELIIGLAPGSAAPGLMKFVDFGNASFPEYDVTASASWGHNNAEGAFSVAASAFFDTPAFGQSPPLPEPFTSLGGTPILFDIDGMRFGSPLDRGKVDFTAVDGGNTTFFGGDIAEDPDSFPNFFGTSAAAPAAAALTALLLEAIPTSSRQQISDALKNTAIDMAVAGVDPLTGAGLIQGPAALAELFSFPNLFKGGGADNAFNGKGGNDTLTGGGGNDTLQGGSGNDRLIGGGGDDMLLGQNNDDYLDGGGGANDLQGGGGADKLIDKAGGDTLRGGTGDDLYLVFGPGTTIIEALDEGTDAIRARVAIVMPDNVENLTMLGGQNLTADGNGLNNDITGNAGNNLVNGRGGNDFLTGRAGNDTLEGRVGNDTLRGDRGSDSLDGGNDDDVLFGDKGLDTLTGGSGADVFTFLDDSQFDTITDYQDGIDKIRLSDYRQENGGTKLTFDQLLITQQGANTRIQLDLDRNGIADVIDLDDDGSGDGWSVTLLNTNAATVDAADFIF